MIHRYENGKVAFIATIRYAIATIFPFWDGDALGRAYTPAEKRIKFPPKIEAKRLPKIED